MKRKHCWNSNTDFMLPFEPSLANKHLRAVTDNICEATGCFPGAQHSEITGYSSFPLSTGQGFHFLLDCTSLLLMHLSICKFLLLNSLRGPHPMASSESRWYLLFDMHLRVRSSQELHFGKGGWDQNVVDTKNSKWMEGPSKRKLASQSEGYWAVGERQSRMRTWVLCSPRRGRQLKAGEWHGQPPGSQRPFWLFPREWVLRASRSRQRKLMKGDFTVKVRGGNSSSNGLEQCF